MTVKTFTTAAKREALNDSIFEDAEPLDIQVDDDTFTLMPPTSGQMALIVTTMNEDDPRSQIAGVIDFLDAVLADEDRHRFRKRLFKRNDPLDLETVQEIISYAIGEWSARPTESSDGSTPSRPTSGKSSTVRRRSVE
jgi:hypothetical protein